MHVVVIRHTDSLTSDRVPGLCFSFFFFLFFFFGPVRSVTKSPIFLTSQTSYYVIKDHMRITC